MGGLPLLAFGSGAPGPMLAGDAEVAGVAMPARPARSFLAEVNPDIHKFEVVQIAVAGHGVDLE